MFVVDFVHFYLESKISKQHLGEFKKDFGYKLHLDKASFDEHDYNSEFEYSTDHKSLDEFRKYVRSWLNDHNFDFDFIILSSKISLYTSKKLSKSQIEEYQDEFEVKCEKYTITCNSSQIKYEFG